MTDEISIEFDPVKDAKNLAKHRVSLEAAVDFEWETARTVEDQRFKYAEPRFEATGWMRGRLHIAVYCYRGNKTRMISLRKANEREFDNYVGKA